MTPRCASFALASAVGKGHSSRIGDQRIGILPSTLRRSWVLDTVADADQADRSTPRHDDADRLAHDALAGQRQQRSVRRHPSYNRLTTPRSRSASWRHPNQWQSCNNQSPNARSAFYSVAVCSVPEKVNETWGVTFMGGPDTGPHSLGVVVATGSFAETRTKPVSVGGDCGPSVSANWFVDGLNASAARRSPTRSATWRAWTARAAC